MRKDLDDLTLPIIKIYNEIERDLLVAVAQRFDTYETLGGTLQWHTKKLEELGALNNDSVKVIASHSTRSEKTIREMLNKAGYANIDLDVLDRAFEVGAMAVNPSAMMQSPVLSAVLDHSFKQINKSYRLINTKAIESVKQSYMDVLNKAYIEVSNGIYDYNTSIRKALQSMAAQGITGATYRRGGTVVNYSLEGTVRRDTLTAVHQLANRVSFDSCSELGAEYVEVSQHIGARVSTTNHIANHAGWQGKVYKIHGFDSEYGNLKNNTGYPDDIQGLGGVNCRHRMFPFFPGISVKNPIQYDEKENVRIYKLSQIQRAKERKIRQTQKQIAVAKASNDNEEVERLELKLYQQRKDIAQWCEDNDMKRDFNREIIE